MSAEYCRVLHLMCGRVGRAGAWISFLQVCALVVAYKSMEPAECVSFYSVFSLFAFLQVMNSTFYFICYLAVDKMGFTLGPDEEAGTGSLKEALLVGSPTEVFLEQSV